MFYLRKEMFYLRKKGNVLFKKGNVLFKKEGDVSFNNASTHFLQI